MSTTRHQLYDFFKPKIFILERISDTPQFKTDDEASDLQNIFLMPAGRTLQFLIRPSNPNWGIFL